MFGQSLLSGAFGGAACTTDTDQLFTSDVTTTTIATYQLNNATTSIPDNNYPGTFTTPAYVTGKFGNAATFNGTTSRINTGYYQDGQIYSVSFWAKNLNGDSVFRDTPSSGGGDTRMDVTVVAATKGVGLGANIGLVPSFTPNSTIWNHYVVSLDGSTAKIYANGVEVGSKSYTPRTGYAGSGSAVNPVCMMSNGLYPAGFGSGNLDQVRIFNTAIPQSAVTALYNETVATSSSADVNYQLANPNSVAYYKMSDATDQLGNYNGTADKVNFSTEGKFGFAGKFNGSDSYVSLPAGINKNNNFSWSFWIKFDSMTQYDTPIGFFMNGSTNFIDMVSVGRLGFYDGNSRLNTPTGTFATGNWYHVVLSKSSTTGRKFYVNGIQVASDSVNTNSGGTTGGRNLFGAYSSGGNPTTAAFALDGKLDQIRIYDSAISAADVTTLYKEIECPAATVINSFNTVIYTGNGSSQNLNIGFNADLTWIKSRTQTYGDNSLVDTLRGAYNLTTNKSAAQEATNGGIVINNNNTVTAAVVSGNLAGETNESGENYVSFNWKGGGTAVSNTDGTIASSVSANKEAGFSVVKYTGTGSTATVGHGLGKPAELILVKVTSASASWAVYSEPTGISKYLELNGQGGTSNYSNYWGSVAPTNSVFGVVNGNFNNNSSGATLIAYCFASIPGYSKVGSYLGIGGTTGNVVYVGFEPSFILIKDSTYSGNWALINNKTAPTNPRKTWIRPNLNLAEFTNSVDSMNFSSTGFQVSGTATSDFINRSGATFIFLAIA